MLECILFMKWWIKFKLFRLVNYVCTYAVCMRWMGKTKTNMRNGEYESRPSEIIREIVIMTSQHENWLVVELCLVC